MKVLFKIKGKVEIINNVSVDDKCFPLVGGIHPYSASSKSKSPLALESSLWFKTLAVDAVYVDCDSSLIFWSEIRNDQISKDVKLRRKGSFVHYDNDFVPVHARPLVSDTTLFDFDPSYKEMIVKSIEVAKKLSHKSVSANDANSMVANLFHVYILPSINFTKADFYALSRARCLIEERHLKADEDIATKAKAINLLQVSLENLKDNLLLKDNYESENYLQTCNMKFLKVFLKKIEEDSLKRNLDLEAQQSKVNWAKEQKYKKEEIAEFQKGRDALFKEVEKLIKVREALKNVVTRKAKVKRKSQARQQIIDSCFHNVFVEILRRLEVENKIIEQLVEDKLNISAAREAVMSVILDLDEDNRMPSDRSTKFEPSTFGDYHPDGKVQVEKSDAWLTLQERVSKLFYDKSSPVSLIHIAGCKNINLQIDLALSEFHLRNKRQSEDRENHIQVQGEPGLQLPTDGPRVITPDLPDAQEEQTDISTKEIVQDEDGVLNHKSVTPESVSPDNEVKLRRALQAHSPCRASRRSGLLIDKETTATNLVEIAEGDHLKSNLEIGEDEGIESSKANSEYFENHGFVIIDDISLVETLETSEQKEKKNFFISENLAVNMLMVAVENVKTGIHEHFKEVVQSLQEHLDPGSVDPFEILWKAYERHFSEEVLQSLTTLYHTMLQPGSSDVYREIQRTSMQDLLEGDKILNLFYQRSTHDLSHDEKTQPPDMISMAKTFSNMSLDVRQYSVNELYSLANADSNDLCRRFQLDTDDHSQEVMEGSVSSSESGESVKTADLFDDIDEDEGISHSNISSSGSSKPDCSKADSFERNQIPFQQGDETKESPAESEMKSTSSAIGSDTPSESSEFLSPHEIIGVMDPVLSLFRKQIVKCMNARSVLDKMRYLSKGVQRLNDDISLLYGPDHVSACDDIISMLVLSLANMPEDIYVGLYSNLRLLIDILPSFLSGTLCDYNLICLCAAYDYMLNRNVCQRVVKRYGASFKVKLTQA